MQSRIKKLASTTSQIREDMWKTDHLGQKKSLSYFYATLRVLTITWIGLKENRIVNRAAALSFSSLLGLGPLVAISVLISGIVLEKTDPDLAVNTIYQAIDFIAPQVEIQPDATDASGEAQIPQQANDGIKNLVQQFITNSQSGAVGVAGTVGLILVVIQLFATIEDTFNDIWGVQRGRNWITRIVMYWTIISLGAVLVFAGIAMFTLQQQRLEEFSSHIPSKTIVDALALYGPRAITFTLIIGLLAAFFRFIPNTNVNWKSSLIGAAFTVCCLIGNNALAFFYVQGVTRQRSLYGSVAILPILMLGLFVFWVIILLGGRMTYAVQNARFRGNKIAWEELSLRSQESICLLVFIKMCRQFSACKDPLDPTIIAEETNLPTQIVNASLNRLKQIGLANPIENAKGSPFKTSCFQPSLPLDKVTVRNFKDRFESFGNTPDSGYFQTFDPCLQSYQEKMENSLSSSFGEQTIAEAIDSTPPSDDSNNTDNSDKLPKDSPA